MWNQVERAGVLKWVDSKVEVWLQRNWKLKVDWKLLKRYFKLYFHKQIGINLLKRACLILF